MGKRLVNVIPAIKFSAAASQAFTYEVPQDLPVLQRGTVVEVQFGKKLVPAVVVGDAEKNPEFLVKPISRILWQIPIITDSLFKLADYISSEYASPIGIVMRLMTIKPTIRAKYKPFIPSVSYDETKQIRLTDEQEQAAGSLLRSQGMKKKILLHGVTGSGKTEVYLKLLEEVVASGQQALVLVPEIALTPQTASRIARRFEPGQTAVVHSKISYGQKAVIWQSVMEGSIKVLVGPRSALFAPFKNLGAIVMDEEHDSSFKQFEQNPKYDARRVALFLGDVWNCPLVFSDATPSVETYHQAVLGKYEKLVLSRRPSQPLPTAELVNMQEEIKSGNFSIFSSRLLSTIKTCLRQSKQVILFINRRGAYTSMVCKDCGKLVNCLRCTAPLVYHYSKRALLCHHCDSSYPVPAKCDNCGSHRLVFHGTGTEKVEQEISKSFPQARVRRLDSDSLTNRSAIERVQQDFVQNGFDILIGTQILARGWDLAGVGLIGVINSDTMLALPDYRANERTFQIVTQVAGRAGRGSFPGKVVIQTFSPENAAIQAAMDQDYQKFFTTELEDRRQFDYPPFSRIIKLSLSKKDERRAESEASSLMDTLQRLKSGSVDIKVLGPVPAFIPKIKNMYVFYVIIKVVQPYEKDLPRELGAALSSLSLDWDIDIDPDSII